MLKTNREYWHSSKVRKWKHFYPKVTNYKLANYLKPQKQTWVNREYDRRNDRLPNKSTNKLRYQPLFPNLHLVWVWNLDIVIV